MKLENHAKGSQSKTWHPDPSQFFDGIDASTKKGSFVVPEPGSKTEENVTHYPKHLIWIVESFSWAQVVLLEVHHEGERRHRCLQEQV